MTYMTVCLRSQSPLISSAYQSQPDNGRDILSAQRDSPPRMTTIDSNFRRSGGIFPDAFTADRLPSTSCVEIRVRMAPGQASGGSRWMFAPYSALTGTRAGVRLVCLLCIGRGLVVAWCQRRAGRVRGVRGVTNTRGRRGPLDAGSGAAAPASVVTGSVRRCRRAPICRPNEGRTRVAASALPL